MQSVLSAIRLRQIILRFSKRLSDRAIARDLHIGRHQLRVIRRLLVATELDYDRLMKLEDEQLLLIVRRVAHEQSELESNSGSTGPDRKETVLNQIDYFRNELNRSGVTLYLLWQEYAQQTEKPYGYSFFCRIVKDALNRKEAAYTRSFLPGEVLMIDFAGDKLSYINRETGEIHEPCTLICTMAYSRYTYVEPLANASTGELINGLNNCLRYLGGVPSIALSDNMKQWVIKSNRYEPIFNTAIEQWANYNGILLEATRPGRPKDKAQIENHVKIIYARIYAPLRDLTFFSLDQLTEAVRRKLEAHNRTNFQSRTYSRHEQFQSDEKHLLSPLPDSPFILRHYTSVKVQINYHVYLGEDKHYYSVPFNLLGERVEVIYDTQTVEIYHKLSRVAIHTRNYKQGGHTTNKDHMPDSHRAIDKEIKETGEELLRRASGYGIETRQYVEAMFNSRSHPTHAYKPVQGILSLGSVKKYGAQRLENACRLGLTLNQYSFRIIESILKNSQDIIQENKSIANHPGDESVNHENLRGAETFKEDLL